MTFLLLFLSFGDFSFRNLLKKRTCAGVFCLICRFPCLVCSVHSVWLNAYWEIKVIVGSIKMVSISWELHFLGLAKSIDYPSDSPLLPCAFTTFAKEF